MDFTILSFVYIAYESQRKKLSHIVSLVRMLNTCARANMSRKPNNFLSLFSRFFLQKLIGCICPHDKDVNMHSKEIKQF